MKDCGSCIYFIKYNLAYLKGLCDLLDYKAKSDTGHYCKHWKGIKYKYSKKEKILKKIHEDEINENL